MQILRWLCKVTAEHSKEATSNPSSKKECESDYEDKANCIIIIEQHDICRKLKKPGESKLRFGHFKPFALLFRKDIAKTCFCSSLNLQRLGSFNRRVYWIHSMKMKKEDIGNSEKADSNGPVNNKVQPVTDSAFSSSKNRYDQHRTSDKTNKFRGGKNTKTMSRMKELVRWAAAAKSVKSSKYIGRKVFRNRGAVKAATSDDDQHVDESPKISFRLDVESCSTVTSAYSAAVVPSTLRNDQAGHTSSLNSTPLHDGHHAAYGKGNWIRTDSEFVVLEL